MKVALFSKIPVFPPYGGNRSRILNFCMELRALGCDIEFFLIPSRQMKDCEPKEHESFFGPRKFVILERSRLDTLRFYARNVRCLVRRRCLRHGEAGRVSDIDYLWQRCFEAQIEAIFATRPLDICIVEYVHFSKIFDMAPAGTFKVLDTHDSFSDEFSDEAERCGFLRADKVIAIQEEEASIFRRQLGSHSHRVHVISHFISEREPVPLGDVEGATFLGSNFAANVVSLRYFVSELLPRICATVPDFKLFVAGDIGAAIADHPSVAKLGRVPRVADAFARAPILVNPVRAGTGVKIKLLEAMALGVPSVSTARGVRGLHQEFLGGVAVVADDDADGFAQEVVRLFRDPSLRSLRGQQAYQTVAHWNRQQRKQLKALIEEAKSAMAA